MALFTYLVSKFGVPIIAIVVIEKMWKGYREGKTWMLFVAIAVGGFLLYFLNSPETVLNAPKAIFDKLLEVLK